MFFLTVKKKKRYVLSCCELEKRREGRFKGKPRNKCGTQPELSENTTLGKNKQTNKKPSTRFRKSLLNGPCCSEQIKVCFDFSGSPEVIFYKITKSQLTVMSTTSSSFLPSF